MNRTPCVPEQGDCTGHKNQHGSIPYTVQPSWIPCGATQDPVILGNLNQRNVLHFCRLWTHTGAHECECGHRW